MTPLARPRPRHAALMALLLAACGGGGGGGGGAQDPTPPQPETTTVTRSVASARGLVAAGCTGGRSGGTVFVDAEVEPMVAVSPVNPDLLLAAWQQDRASNGGARALATALSTDGGLTWRRTLQPMSRCGGAAATSPGDHERASDPWVDIGPTGTLHLMGLAFSGTSFEPGSSSEMLVQRSLDGGLTWGAPTSLQRDGDALFNDKNTLTADPTDARFVYAVWDRIDPVGNGPTLLARTVDGGATWQPTREIYRPQVTGGVSQTLANRIVVLTDGPERGLLVNVFAQIDTAGGRSSVRVRAQRSSDQGQTWQDPVTVADHRSVGTADPETGDPVRDGALVPTVAAGPGGVLWVAWQDARFSGGARDAIALSRSTDGGRSWSAPVAVNRNPEVPAFTPTLHVRADGTVGLMHFDLRSNTADRNTLLADLWLLTSRDGSTWRETALERGFDLRRAPVAAGGLFLGDYHGLVSARGQFIGVAAVAGTQDSNRTEVLALRSAGAGTAFFTATHASPASLSRPLALRLDQASSDATARFMEHRLPGWTTRVQQAGPASNQPRR